MTYREIVDKLSRNEVLNDDEYRVLIQGDDEQGVRYLFEKAREIRHSIYGKNIYIRGLIEISNYCKNDCLYCGIRRSNSSVLRYRLSYEQIMNCVDIGYSLGFRTFVLQGGEDGLFTDEVLCKIVSSIKSRYSDCAVTLSMGERSFESYKALYEAGADRYLLRHETANEEHYNKLHPREMSLANRKKCLNELKSIGFQTGCGMMIGSPYQTIDNLIEDIRFIRDFKPEMVGIGPFIPHSETPFAGNESGSVKTTLIILAIIRIENPGVLLPATTALATLSDSGRERGILAGANVVMPNLSPKDARDNYNLYNNKLAEGMEAVEGLEELSNKMNDIGYRIVIDRGDSKC